MLGKLIRVTEELYLYTLEKWKRNRLYATAGATPKADVRNISG